MSGAMAWDKIVKAVTPYVVKIETPRGHGTGFVCLYVLDKSYFGIATAHHVIEHAENWLEPIRIHHHASKKTIFLKEDDRVIFSDVAKDSAVILVQLGELDLPQKLIPLLPIETRLPIGAQVGWLGYPAVSGHPLCFFSGSVSAFEDSRHSYLVDGVAINGVSGGPVLYSTLTGSVQIVGSITAYIANRATGEALPGLSVAQDVSHLHSTVKTMKTIEEGAAKIRAQKAEQAAKTAPVVAEPEAKAEDEVPQAAGDG